MSILHHFGQVKRKYEPYVSPVPYFDNEINLTHSFGIDYCVGNYLCALPHKTVCLKDIFNQDDIEKFKRYVTNTSNYSNHGIPQSGSSKTIHSGYTHDDSNFSFTNLKETFYRCLSVVREKIESSLWKSLHLNPLVNIMDLLILKQWDTDSRLDHLEKIIQGLMDDNKTLQTKINSLEQMSLFKEKKQVKKCDTFEHSDIPIAYPLSVAEEILFD